MYVCVFLPLLADCQPASAVCGGVGSVAAVEKEEQEEQCYGSSQSSPLSFPNGDNKGNFFKQELFLKLH